MMPHSYTSIQLLWCSSSHAAALVQQLSCCSTYAATVTFTQQHSGSSIHVALMQQHSRSSTFAVALTLQVVQDCFTTLSLSHCSIVAAALQGSLRVTLQHLCHHIHAAAFTLQHSRCSCSTYATAFTQQHLCCRAHTTALCSTSHAASAALVQQRSRCSIYAAIFTQPHSRSTYATELAPLLLCCHAHTAAFKRRVVQHLARSSIFSRSIHAAALTQQHFCRRIYAATSAQWHLRCSSSAGALQVDEDHLERISSFQR